MADPSMARPNFEQRRIVRVDVREHSLHRAAATTGE
jgi:hypothetical protein